MTRRISAAAGAFHQEAELARLERKNAHTFQGVGNDRSLPPRQNTRPSPGTPILLDQKTLGCATALRNLREPPALVGRKQDCSVGPPASAVRIGGIAEDHGLAARYRNFLQFVVGEKTNPKAIGRKEGSERAFGARNRYGLCLA